MGIMDLEATFAQIPPLHQSEGDNNNLPPNQGPELCQVSKKIHQFYFVKFRSYEYSELKAKIEEAEKVIREKNKVRIWIREKNLGLKMYERNRLKYQLKFLKQQDRGCSINVPWKRENLEFLQQALDRHGCANNASQRRAIGLCSSVEELKDHTQGYHYRMLHKSKSLAEEKKLLREIKQLEGTMEKVVANSATKTEIWDYLSSKKAKQDQINVTGFHFERRQLEVRVKIKLLKQEMEAIEKEISSLRKELKNIYQKKDEAHAYIFEEIKQHDKVNACYYQYLSILSNARELAEKKDVAALEELSHREVEKFMSQWSNNKAFRDDYEKRILQSLDSQQLSMDGRMRNPGDKTLALEAPTHVIPETQGEKQT